MDVGEVAMADDLGLRVRPLEILQQEPEGCLLFGSTGVVVAPLVVDATDIADTYGMLVVVAHVGSGILLVTAFVDATVLIDDPVVAYHGPVLGFVTAVDVFDSPLPAGSCSRAVDDDVEDILHGFHFFLHNEHGLVTHTRLNGQGAEDRSDNSCDKFKDLRNFGPVYFDHNEHKFNE